MSRNLCEPSIYRSVAANRYVSKDTRQRPYAGEWVHPVDDAECPPLEGGLDQFGNVTHLWTPCLINNWLQVDPADANLESFAFRIHYDGSLEFKGHLDASGGATSGTVAFLLPGLNTLEPDYIDALDHSQFWDSIITDDAGITFIDAGILIDALTAEVTITWPIN